MFSRSVFLLAAALCVAPLAAATAQLAPDSVRVTSPTTSAPGNSTGASLQGPRVSPQIPRVAPTPAPRRLSEHASLQNGGGRHTITISTLALVLGVIIIVLLVR